MACFEIENPLPRLGYRGRSPAQAFEMNLPWSTLNEDPTDVGCPYPPHQTMGANYDYQAEDSVHRIPRDRFADFEPTFKTVVFEPGAKRHDLMASAPIPHYGWLISARFLNLLSDFTLPPHRVYLLPVIQRGRAVEGYVWLHLPQPINTLAVSMSLREAEEKIASDTTIAELDVLPIYLPVRFGYFFVSRRLRQAIENAQLTGIRFGTSKLFRVVHPTSANKAVNPSGGSGGF